MIAVEFEEPEFDQSLLDVPLRTVGEILAILGVMQSLFLLAALAASVGDLGDLVWNWAVDEHLPDVGKRANGASAAVLVGRCGRNCRIVSVFVLVASGRAARSVVAIAA